MIFKKPESKPAVNNQRSEFNERIASILLSFCRGMSAWLPSTDPLQKKIQELLKVLKKAARPKPAVGLAQEIQHYFEKVNLEDDAKNFERSQVKSFFSDLENVIGRMSSSSGGINKEMGGVIDEFATLESISDLEVVKGKIIKGLSKIKEETGRMEEELEMYREKTESLAKKLQETESLGFTDQLTRLYNRHAFEVQVSDWFPDGISNTNNLNIIMGDIDEFKKFNDIHGHQTGDMVLKFVADTLREALETKGKIYRYGGEEFLIFLPGMEFESAAKIAENIRKRLEKDYYIEKSKKLMVTMSLGVACTKEGETLEDVLEKVDQALYGSKEKGRNRVTIAN
ncbi:MAG: diguanylate cyclase [Candidatus Nitronauta litoralis]|uniref:diguanylate cyclase n=1 Tax=Candidatus Nitronauta litoralis TaxID=2705533 RepID=A0A7T0G0Q6_9BACT|nr:MAG: diguanylate cyclase [Candidatus Nitronauta litoralis]